MVILWANIQCNYDSRTRVVAQVLQVSVGLAHRMGSATMWVVGYLVVQKQLQNKWQVLSS